MKKLFTSTIVVALVATLMGVFVACGDKDDGNDAAIAQKAIATVRTLYADKAVETPTDYEVNGTQKVDNKTYTIKWTVSSDFTNYGNYITVGKMDATTKKVTIGITKATEEINYKLKATVTVGKASKSAEFTRKVPAGQAGEDQVEKTLSFADKANRTSQTAAQQVWTQNGITLTNDKGASTTDVADSANPVRLYKSSSIKIEYPGMTNIIFHSAALVGTSDYPANLKNSLEAANLGTVTVDGSDISLQLAAPSDVVEFTASAGQIRLASIDVVANKNGATDADKVAAAKATLDVADKNYTAVGTYDLPAEKNGATVTWAIKGTSANASIEDGKLKITSMPEAETAITLVATITVNEANDTKEIAVKLVPLGLVNDGTLAKPYTPSEAKKVIALLEEGATSDAKYYVKGYVIAPGTYSEQYGNFDDMYIADEAGKPITDATALLVFRPKADGAYLTTEGFNNGDLVTFQGNFQNYKKDETLTPELVNGTCVAKVAAERSDAQIVADAKAAVDLAKKTYSTEGEEVELAASYKGATLAWAVKGETTLVEISEGKLKIKSIPQTATTVTLTLTITSNGANDTKEIAISVEPLTLDHAGTQADPYSLADVAKIGESLANSAYYGDDQVFVKGYIVDPGSWSSSYNNYSQIWLIDDYAADKDKNSEGAIQLYRLGKDNTYVTGDGKIAKGDLITVQGFIQKYNNKVQVSYKGSVNPTAVYLLKAGETPKTDAELIEEAKNAATLSATYEAGEVDLPAGHANGAAYSWAVKTGGDNATISDGKMTLTAGDAEVSVTVTVTVSKGEAASQAKDITFTILAASTKGTEADPYTVEEAMTILNGLENGTTYQVGGADKLVYITGYVVAAGTVSTNGRYDVKIADAATTNAADGLLIYNHRYSGDFTKDTELEVGDKVLVSGYLKVYNNTKEIANSTTYPTIKITQKVVLTDEQKAQKALDKIAATLPNITATGEVTLDTTTTVDGVALAWSTEDTTYTVTDNKLSVAALPTDADVTVTLKVTATCGEATKDKNVTVIVKAPLTGVTEETINFATNFSTYGGSWGTNYTAHEITFTQAGATKLTGSVALSNANKQSSTITDRPCLCAKNSAQTVTVTITNGAIAEVSFDLMQWQSKTFKDIHIEYYNGTDWTTCSGTITTPGKITSTSIPAGVKQVRLSFVASSSSNTQMGLSAISLKVNADAETGGETGGEQGGEQTTTPEAVLNDEQ